MERLVKGDVVVVPFPFSDLSGVKRRPALVIATPEGADILLCQITGRKRYDNYSITLESSDFSKGHLPISSFIRPNKLFTAEKSIVIYTAGSISQRKLLHVIGKIKEILDE